MKKLTVASLNRSANFIKLQRQLKGKGERANKIIAMLQTIIDTSVGKPGEARLSCIEQFLEDIRNEQERRKLKTEASN